MVYTLLVCRAAMDFTWWMLLLFLVGWGALAVLALLYGMKRQGAVQSAVQQRTHPCVHAFRHPCIHASVHPCQSAFLPARPAA